MALRLPTEQFQTGMQIGSRSNALGNSIRQTLQRYETVRAQKEELASAVSLHKQKTMAEFDLKKSMLPTSPPEGTEVSGYDEYGSPKGYKKMGLKDVLMNKVLKGGKGSLNPNELVLWDEIMRSGDSISEQAFANVGEGGDSTTTTLPKPANVAQADWDAATEQQKKDFLGIR